jgi:hypothetical protein
MAGGARFDDLEPAWMREVVFYLSVFDLLYGKFSWAARAAASDSG